MTTALAWGRDGRPAALSHLDCTAGGGQEVGTLSRSPRRQDLQADGPGEAVLRRQGNRTPS